MKREKKYLKASWEQIFASRVKTHSATCCSQQNVLINLASLAALANFVVVVVVNAIVVHTLIQSVW